MSMRQTSMDAFLSILDDGSLGRRKKEVFDVIKREGPISNKDIAYRLGLPINCVTGRTTSLVEDELVVARCKGFDSVTKHKCILWGVK